MRHPQYDIFLAHANDDTQVAEALYELLQPSMTVFLDSKTLIPGDDWGTVLPQAQRDALMTVVLISQSTKKAFYQREEIAEAIVLARDDPATHRVIPVYIDNLSRDEVPGDGIASDSVPYGLRTKHSITMQSSTTLQEVAQKLRNTLTRLKPSVMNQQDPVIDHALLQHYRDQLMDQVRHVDLFHLKHLTGNVPFPIDQIYVPLKVNPRELRAGTSALTALQDTELRYLSEQDKQPKPLGELLNHLFDLAQYRCMLVLGKPGAGKTTLLKYLAYYFASGRQQEIPPGFSQRTPFYVRLKDIKDTVIAARTTQSVRDEVKNPSKSPSLAQAIILNLQIRGYRTLPNEETLEAWLQGAALVLLDGLDEVADADQRQQVADWVKYQVKAYNNAHFIISSRLHGYSPYYAPDASFTVEVDDFNQESRHQFLQRWFGHVYRDRSARQKAPAWQAESMARQLAETIEADHSQHLQDLARNPLLLSMIALVQLALLDEQKEANVGVTLTLPRSRSLLYEHCIALFIREWNWDQVRQVGIHAMDAQRYRSLLEHAALYLQCQSPKLPTLQTPSPHHPAQPSYSEKRTIIAHLQTALKLDEATLNHCLQHSHDRTLLLVEQSLNQWGFQHKTFQEYLTAQAVIGALQRQPVDAAPLDTLIDHLGQDHWRVVFELFIEQLQAIDNNDLIQSVLRTIGQRLKDDAALAARAWDWIEALHDHQVFAFPEAERHRLQQNCWQLLAVSDDPIALCKFHHFAARGLAALALSSARVGERLTAMENNLRQSIHHVLLLPEIIAEPETALIDQLQSYLTVNIPTALSGAVALTLQRYGVGDPQVLDRHLFVTIPAGEFYRGSLKGEDEANEAEIDGHRHHLPGYEIARYPVTNAQYQGFIAATQHPLSEFSDWKNGQYPKGRGHYPVDCVTWHDAKAYVDWLNQQQQGGTYTLPTEAQRERAARGAAAINGEENRRRYPWGDAFDHTNCNVEETGLNRTTAVGCFPEGASVEGVLELAGNVWEWCADWYDGNYYQQGLVDENKTQGDGWKGVRGGSFDVDARDARCAYRLNLHPDLVNHDVGFRVARIRHP